MAPRGLPRYADRARWGASLGRV